MIRTARKQTSIISTRSAAILVLLLALVPAGCGNFWQNPNGSSSTGTSSSGGSTASSTTLTVASTSISAGTGDGLTAAVSPSAATGTVTFLSNGAIIGSATLSGGTATYTATFTSAGVDTVSASYGGDSTYASSSSNAATVTVTTATSLASPGLQSLTAPHSATNLVLDPAGSWTVSASSYPHNIAGLAIRGTAVQNIQSDGHCVYYSGKAYIASGTANANGVYTLPGGGFLAPEGTTGLDCD